MKNFFKALSVTSIIFTGSIVGGHLDDVLAADVRDDARPHTVTLEDCLAAMQYNIMASKMVAHSLESADKKHEDCNLIYIPAEDELKESDE